VRLEDYMRWRRVCVDLSDDDQVLGGSVEFFSTFDQPHYSYLIVEPVSTASHSPEQMFERMKEARTGEPALPGLEGF